MFNGIVVALLIFEAGVGVLVGTTVGVVLGVPQLQDRGVLGGGASTPRFGCTARARVRARPSYNTLILPEIMPDLFTCLEYTVCTSAYIYERTCYALRGRAVDGLETVGGSNHSKDAQCLHDSLQRLARRSSTRTRRARFQRPPSG